MSIRRTLLTLLAIAISTTVLLALTLFFQAATMSTTREDLAWSATDLELHITLLVDASDHVRQAHELFSLTNIDHPIEASAQRINRDFDAIKKHHQQAQQELREREVNEVDRLFKMKEVFDSIAASVQDIHRLFKGGRIEEARDKLKQISEQTYEIEFLALLNDAVTDERQEMAETLREAEQAERWIKIVSISMIVMVSLLFVSLVWRLLQKLNHGFSTMRTATQRLATGSIDHRIDPPDKHEFGELAQTFNLMAEQLGEARARIEKLAAVGQLAGGVAHDLRNPLGAVRNAAHYIKKRLPETQLADNPRIMQAVAVLDKEVAACTRIIADLLDYTRERSLSRSACALQPLVADALSVMVTPPSTQIKNDVPESFPVLDLDKDQMRQALINLIQNAVEAIPKGQDGLVHIKTQSTDDTLVLSIVDNGKGIAKEDQERIFEPLYSTKEQGTGLGLAITADIVRRHKATLTVNSELGKGTTFSIRFPRNRAHS